MPLGSHNNAFLGLYRQGDLDADEAFFHHADHLGSVRLLSDASGAVVNDDVFDAYGRVVSGFEAVASPFAYTGREHDRETGRHVPVRTAASLLARKSELFLYINDVDMAEQRVWYERLSAVIAC